MALCGLDGTRGLRKRTTLHPAILRKNEMAWRDAPWWVAARWQPNGHIVQFSFGEGDYSVDLQGLPSAVRISGTGNVILWHGSIFSYHDDIIRGKCVHGFSVRVELLDSAPPIAWVQVHHHDGETLMIGSTYDIDSARVWCEQVNKLYTK